MSEPTSAANRPRLLDLFCGAGGAAMGYHRAGFDVVGVDNRPQPHYPFHFIQADAFEYMHELISISATLLDYPDFQVDAIHASPPCQAFTLARVIHGREHADLLTPTRTLLEQTDLPWVIENVPGAPMRIDLVLCGTAFPELRVRRHRWFEFSDPSIAPVLVNCCNHSRKTVPVFGHGGHIYHGVQDWKEAMGIDWMNRDELAQAIPPAYTEHIGQQLIAHVRQEVAA